MGNIVKYHNDLNVITFYEFGQVDFDFLMVLCSKLRDAQDNEITLTFKEFKQLSGYSINTSEKRFIRELKEMNRKQLQSVGEIEKSDGDIDQFNLFSKFSISPKRKEITVKVNEDYRYMLNELTSNFTRFELQEFVNLESKYAKILYRLLKQYRTTGYYRVHIDEFRRLFSVPKSYSNYRILDKIIKPSIKSLEEAFKNLRCNAIYESKPGRPIQAYEFRFKAEKAKVQMISDHLNDTDQEETEIKIVAHRPAPEKKKNKFHHFEQREYDDGFYDRLEDAMQKRDKEREEDGQTDS